MPRTTFILILAAAAALAQTPAQKTTTAVPAKPAASPVAGEKSKGQPVASTEPVIVIHGLCVKAGQSKQTAQAGLCQTAVTRQEFETFLKVLNATTRGIDPENYRNAAESYSSLLISSELGQKAGAQKDPRFEQILDVARLNALGQMYRVQRFKEALEVPADQVEAYYKKNIYGYEEVGLDRFLLPKNNPANLSDLEFREKASQLAVELHARAVKGEDIYKLEKEGLQGLGLKEDPAVVPVAVRRGQFGEKENKELFALGPGEVTSLWDSPGLWMFYKRTSRRTLPLEVVGGEIRGKLTFENIDTLNKRLHDAVHVDYNEAYFGPSPAALKGKPAPPAQTAAHATPEGNSPANKTVAPSDAVMTIRGLCGSHKQDLVPGSCTLVLTREQFETLMKVKVLTTPNPAQNQPRIFAENHLDLLIYGEAAERVGIEKDPRFPDVMNVARRRALSDMYRLKLDEDAHQVSAGEIEAYYKKNPTGFDEITLLHVSVPRDEPGASKDPGFDAKAKSLAGQLRERAVKGEDMEELQKEAYGTLGIKDPPPTLMRPIRRGTLEEHAEREVLALTPGQVTTVQEFPPAYVIYKLESRRVIPLEEAKTEISQILYQKNLERLMKAPGVMRAEYNPRYFAAVSPGGSIHAGERAAAPKKSSSLK